MLTFFLPPPPPPPPGPLCVFPPIPPSARSAPSRAPPTAIMTSESRLPDAIAAALLGAHSKSLPVKDLRRQVLLALQEDDGDREAKKEFKRAVKAMESDGLLKLGADGMAKLSKKGRKAGKGDSKKKDKKDKKKKKEKRQKDDGDEEAERDSKKRKVDEEYAEGEAGGDEGETDAAAEGGGGDAADDKNRGWEKNKPCKGNPSGITRLFLGNLPFAVDETSLNDYLGGHMTHTKWITDKETGRFYGSAFVEMRNAKDAADAVALAGTELMGRETKINFAESRPGDVWPPKTAVVTGGGERVGTAGGGQAGGVGITALRERPEGCHKLFCGNLSYEIDDDAITKFFANVDAEVKAVRWIHHKDSGDFKGVGFVEFWKEEACEKAAALNGKVLLGRPIRIDWTD